MSAVVVFGFMFEIDHYAVLFIISPLIGNYWFGNLKNKYEFKRYEEQAPNEKVLNYVSRMMYHTMLFISHRLSSVKNCDKVFMLEKGQLIEEGTHKDLIAANKSYAQMWKVQAGAYIAV